MSRSRLAILLSLAITWSACTDLPAPYPPAPVTVKFRAHGDYFEIDRGQGWQKFIVNGVDLAIAKPGYYPGDLAAQRADYDRWLAGIAEMGTNVIRVYTLHYPVFYEAFRDWNVNHPDKPLSHDGNDTAGDQVCRHAHVDEARNGARRIVRM